MTTYGNLRDKVLRDNDNLGQTEYETVVETALAEAMRFVSFHVKILSLIKKDTFTALADPHLEANAIPLKTSGGFNATDLILLDQVYVKEDSDVVGYGSPYTCKEYWDVLQMLSGDVSLNARNYYEGADLPRKWYTITPDDKLWLSPIIEDNVITIFYKVQPGEFDAAETPEINPYFDWILTMGADIALKAHKNQPDSMVNYWELFTAKLMTHVNTYKEHLLGSRRRDVLKIHRSYRP